MGKMTENNKKWKKMVKMSKNEKNDWKRQNKDQKRPKIEIKQWNIEKTKEWRKITKDEQKWRKITANDEKKTTNDAKMQEIGKIFEKSKMTNINPTTNKKYFFLAPVANWGQFN